MRPGHYGAKDLTLLGRGVDPREPAAIELDAAHWKLVQVRERRIAGAEIVDPDADAKVIEPLERSMRSLLVRNEGALCQLQDEALGGQGAGGERLSDVLAEVRSLELDRRDV